MPPTTAAGKRRALANLRQHRSLTPSKAFARVPSDAIAAKRQEVEAILQGDAAGWLQPSDSVTVDLLARVLVRLDAIDGTEAIDRWLRQQAHAAKPVMGMPGFVQIYLRLLERAHRLSESLGLTPVSRNRLGIVAGAGLDLAAALAAMSKGEKSCPPAFRSDGPAPPEEKSSNDEVEE
ncbi:MAG TPA: hypothetical protein VKV57_04210 [bacterium]|nr:hypothetical protein [bacterium]